jgi:hypothetical protein
MIRRWQYSSHMLYRLSIGIAAVLLMAAGWYAVPAGAAAPAAPPTAAPTTDAPPPESQALLRALESLDPSKPETVAVLKDAVAQLFRRCDAQQKEIEALRAELQTLRAAPSTTPSSSTRRRTSKPTASSSSPTATSPRTASSTAAANSQTPFFAKTGGKSKVHRTGCMFGERIKESDRVYFKTLDEATKAGYEACKVCKPGG